MVSFDSPATLQASTSYGLGGGTQEGEIFQNNIGLPGLVFGLPRAFGPVRFFPTIAEKHLRKGEVLNEVLKCLTTWRILST